MPHPWIAFFFGVAFASVAVISLVKGKALCGCLIKRSERPVFFWFAVLVWLTLALIALIGSGRELLK